MMYCLRNDLGYELQLTILNVGQVYEQHRHEDGFLYMVYASQEVFG